MKDKLLKAEIMTACEKIARAMRTYTGESLACSIYVSTHEVNHALGDQDCDVVTAETHFNTEDGEGDIFSEHFRIYYSFDRFDGERISYVEKVKEEGEEDGP